MTQNCTLAQTDSISAVYVMNRLIIIATGSKPSPCYDVKVTQSPLRIFPPAYQVEQCIDPGRICPQVVVPYRAVGMFGGVFPRETVTVYRDGGSEEVPVRVLPDDPIGSPVSALAGVKGDAGGPADDGAVLRLGRFLETGEPGDISATAGRRVEATGYSDTFSFTEAFNDAVGNLPPDPNPYPDKLTTVTVAAIGAEYGSILGLHRLFVRVYTYH